MSDSNKLTLADGTVVQMVALNQSFTYEGLREGLPTMDMNSSIVASALRAAQGIWKDTPQLIRPEEVPISFPGQYPFGTPARIPAIKCVSRWSSQFESRGEVAGSAEGTIVWFQMEFALPIDETVVMQLQKLKWHAVSSFHEW